MQPLESDLRVLVVADDPLVRAGLAALLADQPNCTVVGQVSPSEYASAGADVYEPYALVWDLGWDAGSALEHLGDSAGSGPPTVALVTDESHAAAAWSAGARGVLTRDVDGARLVTALSVVVQGLAVVEPDLAPFAAQTGDDALQPSHVELTRRELEVLRLMAEGLPNKAIARRLSISEHTVKFHVNAILGKLGAQSRTEAVTRATRMGLILL